MPAGAAGVPLFSVVTPVWNAAATLAGTVASVRAQSLADWELLLVDDASTDGSLALARALAAGDPRIRVLARETNGGAATARNDAIRAARGRFIAFLDADDRWYSEKLARQQAFMAESGHAFVYLRLPPGRGRRHAARRRAAAASGLARRAAQGQRHRLPDRGLRHRGLRPGRDADRCAAARTTVSGSGCCGRCPTPTPCPRCSPTTGWRPPRSRAASSRPPLATWRLYREVEGLGRPRAGFYLAHNLARALAKRG